MTKEIILKKIKTYLVNKFECDISDLDKISMNYVDEK